MDFYGFVEVIISLALGGGIGWIFGSKINQAKIYNVLLKPFTKKEKMVALVSGENFDIRPILVNRPLGTEPIVIKHGSQVITRIPVSSRNKSEKGVVIGLFDSRFAFQLPMETDYLQYALIVNGADGKVVATDIVENKRMTDSKVDGQAAQNYLMSAAQWGKTQGKGEVNDDIKKLKKFIYIILFLGVVTLIISLLGAKYGSDALNVVGTLSTNLGAGVNASSISYPAS